MKLRKKEWLDKLKRAYEMEEVMAALLTDLAMPHVLTSKSPEQERQKVRKMLALIRADTLEHKKIVAEMIRTISGGSFGV